MRGKFFISAVLSFVILTVGVGAMYILIAGRQAPVEATLPTEKRISVETLVAAPVDKQVFLEGFGEVRPKRTTVIATEISGIVVDVHPNFEVGGLVNQGDFLYQLDPRQYLAQQQEARAQVGRARITVKRLETELSNETNRLLTLQRNLELAEAELQRSRDLMNDAIGNQKDVDEAEQKVNDVINQVKQLEHQVAIYPIQIEEARQDLQVQQSRLKQAELALERTRVITPFDARITRVHVELGQLVSPASPAVELADDTLLEIPVKLDAGEVRQWLRFKQKNGRAGSWFGEVEPVPCEIIWDDGDQQSRWTGQLDRVEQYDSDTRTVTVTAQYSARTAHDTPLIAGMFCQVKLPGKTLSNVIPIPRSAFTIDQKLYAARDDRLKTLDITVAYADVDTVYISEGIEPGDQIITTRLINPLENSLLQATRADPAATE